ncbi:GAF domain-containing protein [Arthrobacter sp. M4]|uniref:GAF domain-containing protein n=1 Tax=Arthrobacter sp. M4 TaxID=218160 RepID=UPI001CDD3737|nr:GAF domain-containing protein [Arthrobacter sp. M4]MCA4135242.1 GAF domain-containing protein [Arthrobacter sp. M4]
MTTTEASVFQRVFDSLSQDPGVVLFTALQWIPERSALRRVFTSHPDAYPLGAEKTVEVSPGWLGTVIADKKPFLAADLSGLKEVFTDVELIQSLGCGGVINIPVLRDGDVVGVLALLDAEGRYTQRSVETATTTVAASAAELAAAFAEPEETNHQEIKEAARKDALQP